MMRAKMSLPRGVVTTLVFKELEQSLCDRFNDRLVSRLLASIRLRVSLKYSEKLGCEISILMKIIVLSVLRII